ncbi:Hypothetical predicted protein [Octopus vulgaris]|uniref:Uncharacterized protein n=1 Tax=Octopus vulgaris TaxID=6645 RepID=A0AA36EXV0_OCTVU|nr:Hypothetical predicted protein [Octopus vulgaris]
MPLVTQADIGCAPYEIAYFMTISKKPYTTIPVAEILVQKNVRRTENRVKSLKVSVSKSIIFCWIDDNGEDIKMQVVVKMKAPAHKFAIQLDELANVSHCANLICIAGSFVGD